MSTGSGSRFWFPLDGSIGPAACIAPSRAAELVEIAMKRACSTRSERARIGSRGHLPKMLLASAAAVAVPATVAAGVVHWAADRRPAGPVIITWEAPAARAERNATSPRGPQEMLQRANDLRAKHQWLEATQAYEQTARDYPGEAEAYSAMVAAGSLRLDHLGDARGALWLFAAVLRERPGGALSEESQWGAIEAHRALGDRAAEQALLEEFVRLHPHSLLSPHAQLRLRELERDTP